MDIKHLILVILIASALICIPTIISAESNMPSDTLLGWNPFADDSSDDLTIKFLHIQHIKKSKDDRGGNFKEVNTYNLKFKVMSNIDSMKIYGARVTCFDADGKVIDTVDSNIIREGTNKIPLKCGSNIKKAELVIKDDSGNEIFKDFTDQIKLLEK